MENIALPGSDHAGRAGNTAYIDIYGNTVADNTSSAADNLPELPAEFNWAVMDHPDAFVYEAQCADPQWVESYVNDLKALGYELVDESHDGDWVRIRLYHSAEDHVVYIEYNEKLSYTYAEIGK